MNEATILTHSQKSQFIKEYVRFFASSVGDSHMHANVRQTDQ